MLGIIKDWFNDPARVGDKIAALQNLRADASLRFSSAITGRLVSRFAYRVTGLGTYYFGADHFVSHALTGFGEEQLNMILVLEEEAPYFALSKPITADQMRMTVGEKNVKLFLSGTFPGQILAQQSAAPGWIATSYSRMLSNESGKFAEASESERGAASREMMAQPFDYALYADETGEYALEIEQYTDGRTKFFATVYLPLEDIDDIKSAGPIMPQEVVPVVKRQDSGYELIQHEAVAPTILPPVVHDEAKETLEMEAPLAVRLIEEAQRNQLSLSDLVRRVADLPRRWHDAVMIPIDLQESDYAMLGEKYGIEPFRKNEIRQRLVQELALFAGYEVRQE